MMEEDGLEEAETRNVVVLVTGSLHLVGGVLEVLAEGKEVV